MLYFLPNIFMLGGPGPGLWAQNVSGVGILDAGFLAPRILDYPASGIPGSWIQVMWSREPGAVSGNKAMHGKQAKPTAASVKQSKRGNDKR